MSIFGWILLGTIAISLLYWTVTLVLVLRVVRTVPVLRRGSPREGGTWPTLSLIIPACNEADHIEEALRVRLAEDYPNLEIIVVEDRSTDGTGAIVDRLAAEDPRIRVLHVDRLPKGWLGKVNALQRGTELATGEWLLFSDADVHWDQGTLKRTVDFAEQRKLDHLGIMPRIWSSSFWLDVLMATWFRALCVSVRLWAVENPNSKASMGVGAFNLVRREAFDRSPGWQHLRMTVLDDIGLAQMMKGCGFRTAVVNGREIMGLYFYRTVGEAARGIEKSTYVTFGYSLPWMSAQLAAMIIVECVPFLALVPMGVPFAVPAAAVCVAVALASSLLISNWLRRPLLPALLIPISVVLTAAIFIRAGLIAIRDGGISWRGTLYSFAELKAGNQVRVP